MNSTTTNEKGQDACNACPSENTTNNNADSAACPAFEQQSPDKHRANVRARAALIGIAVHELADGSLLAIWRGCTKHSSDWAGVQHLVRQLGGSA